MLINPLVSEIPIQSLGLSQLRSKYIDKYTFLFPPRLEFQLFPRLTIFLILCSCCACPHFLFSPSFQLEEEIVACLDFVRHVYQVFGFSFHCLLSTRPAPCLGEPEQWDNAEQVNMPKSYRDRPSELSVRGTEVITAIYKQSHRITCWKKHPFKCLAAGRMSNSKTPKNSFLRGTAAIKADSINCTWTL